MFFLAALPSACDRKSQPAQSNSAPNAIAPLVETIATDTTAYSSAHYLFLRVLSDGRLEYHDRFRVDLTQPLPLLNYTLTAADLTELHAVLNDPQVAALSGSFAREDAGVTHAEWIVHIPRRDHLQTIAFVNFGNFHGGPGKPPLPDSAFRLGCTIEKLHYQSPSQSKLFTWTPTDECKKFTAPQQSALQKP